MCNKKKKNITKYMQLKGINMRNIFKINKTKEKTVTSSSLGSFL